MNKFLIHYLQTGMSGNPTFLPVYTRKGVNTSRNWSTAKKNIRDTLRRMVEQRKKQTKKAHKTWSRQSVLLITSWRQHKWGEVQCWHLQGNMAKDCVSAASYCTCRPGTGTNYWVHFFTYCNVIALQISTLDEIHRPTLTVLTCYDSLKEFLLQLNDINEEKNAFHIICFLVLGKMKSLMTGA